MDQFCFPELHELHAVERLFKTVPRLFQDCSKTVRLGWLGWLGVGSRKTRSECSSWRRNEMLGLRSSRKRHAEVCNTDITWYNKHLWNHLGIPPVAKWTWNKKRADINSFLFLSPRKFDPAWLLVFSTSQELCWLHTCSYLFQACRRTKRESRLERRNGHQWTLKGSKAVVGGWLDS